MSAAREVRLWVAQRATAVVLAVCVVVHLATIIYAVRGGLTAAEILARTRGSIAWGAFYSVFVLAAAIHAPIGLRNDRSPSGSAGAATRAELAVHACSRCCSPGRAARGARRCSREASRNHPATGRSSSTASRASRSRFPAAALLGARHRAAGRGALGEFLAWTRAAAGEARRVGARAAARRAPRRRPAPAGARVPAVAQLAEDARRARRGADAWRGPRVRPRA